MTIKELYEWAKARNIENYETHILYRDGGGYYSDYDYLEKEDIHIDKKNKVVEL